MGLPDPAMNARLRAAVLAARAENMPKDNIERAIKKASGADSETYDEVRYEGYAPGGVAVIVEALTDNRNRTAGEVRSYFTKAGGSLAETGAVSFMFDRVGVIAYDRKVADDDAMLEAAIEAGADDVVSGPEEHEVITAVETLAEAQKALEAKFGEPLKASLVWRPQNTIAVDDEAGEKILRLDRPARGERRRSERHGELRDFGRADGEDAGIGRPDRVSTSGRRGHARSTSSAARGDERGASNRGDRTAASPNPSRSGASGPSDPTRHSGCRPKRPARPGRATRG